MFICLTFVNWKGLVIWSKCLSNVFAISKEFSNCIDSWNGKTQLHNNHFGGKRMSFYFSFINFCASLRCNTDLTDSDCEVTVVRGINFNVSNPADVDTYVRIEFPYPTDAPPQERSNTVKDTNNPEFNHKVVFSIDRKARALARIFKRHFVKCQVITKG